MRENQENVCGRSGEQDHESIIMIMYDAFWLKKWISKYQSLLVCPSVILSLSQPCIYCLVFPLQIQDL